MKKLHFKKSNAFKSIILIGLLVLFTSNISWSQTNIYPPNSTRSFELPVISGSGSTAYAYNPTGGTWAFYGQSGITKNGTAFTWANPNAPLGNQVLFLQNNGYVETNYNFTSTGYYRFRFRAAWREGCCEKPKYIRVIVDGVEAGEVELRSKDYEEYWTLPVYLSSGFKIIRLEGDNPSQPGDYTGFVDDFTIQRVYTMPNYNNWILPSGSTYVIGSNTYNFGKLEIKGTLLAAQNRDVNINANLIAVIDNGRLQIGQERSPYQEEATITLNGTNLNQYNHMGTKFVGAMGNGVIELHGKEKESWTKLRETANANTDKLKLVNPVNWEIGDQIVVAPSGTTWNEYEQRTISSISSDKKDITLSSNLSYKHIGALKFYRGNSQTWTVDMRAEVGLLTRNIKIQGDAASVSTRRGAHVMIMGNAQAFINGVELYRMGQEKILGRYPFHWHQRYNASGQYFKNSSVHLSYNRALTIHSTNHTQVHNNFFFDHVGHGIYLEDGSEIGNDIVGNLVMATKRPTPTQALTTSETIDEIQNRGPASFWITHPYNTIRENVATGTVGTGFWYIFPDRDLGGQGVDPQMATFGSFNNNVAHSCTSGFDIYDELRTDESVRSNVGYLNPSDFKVLDCTWYSNALGIYTGTGANWRITSEYGRETYMPNEHLIFDNNVFAENQKDIMQASNNQVINSLFVANTGLGNPTVPNQTLLHKYDGGGIVKDSHIVGYDSSSSSMISFAGAAVSNGNFKFKDVTKTSNLVFNMPSGQTNGVGRRNATIYDEDGSLTGYSGSALIPNNLFLLFGDESTPSGWSNFKRSNRRYENTRILLHLQDSPNWQGFPGAINVKRTKGTTLESLHYGANGSDPILPFIMNDLDLLYTYEFIVPSGQHLQSVLPQNHKLIGFQFLNAVRANDFVIVRFTEIGSLLGLYVDMSSEERLYNGLPNLSVTRRYSLTDLKNYPTSAYFIDGSDLYIKAYTNGDYSQNFNIKWGVSFKNTSTDVDVSEKMIYPNPTSGQLFIKGVAEGDELQIIDLSGKLIQKITYNKYLDVSQLKPGLYIVRTKDKRMKFIKE